MRNWYDIIPPHADIRKGHFDEAAVQAKIPAMPEPYRAMGECLHALILGTTPVLRPRLWYGCRRTRRMAQSSPRSGSGNSSRTVT